MDIVVAQIKSMTPHPQSDLLKICQVTTGEQEFQVICGASNLRVNMKTILACVGATTPPGFTVQKSRIRGQDSHGLLCSAKDLGLSQETGIIDLPSNLSLGRPYSEVPVEYLSSTPWYSYKEVEAFWQDKTSKQIKIFRDGQRPDQPQNYLLLSKTYVHDGQYVYRHFHPLLQEKATTSAV